MMGIFCFDGYVASWTLGDDLWEEEESGRIVTVLDNKELTVTDTPNLFKSSCIHLSKCFPFLFIFSKINLSSLSFNKATNINFVDISLLLLSRLGLCKNHSDNKTVSFQNQIIVELKFDTSHLSEFTPFWIHPP